MSGLSRPPSICVFRVFRGSTPKAGLTADGADPSSKPAVSFPSASSSATESRSKGFGRVHLLTFLGFYLVFAALTFLALAGGTESDRREYPLIAATLGTISGPFTGAIARNFQPCCRSFSLALFPYCAAILAAGVVAQVIPLPFQRFAHPLRLVFWCVGLLGWFGGALLSFAHALS